MVYTTTTIPGSAFDADAPAFIAGNAIIYGENGETYPGGSWNPAGTYDGVSEADPLAPERCSFDGIHTRLTYPDTARTTNYLVHPVDPAAYVDWWYLGNVSCVGANAAVTCTLEIWDGAAWDVIATWSIPVGYQGRHSEKLSSRYAAVDKARLKFTTGGSAFTPAVGEFILGRFLQLEYPPKLPWDPHGRSTQIARMTGYGPKTTSVKLGDPARVADLTTQPNANSTEMSNLQVLHDLTDGFFQPFIFCEHPNLSDDVAYVMFSDPNYSFPLVGPVLHEGVIHMQEVAPTYDSEQ